MDKEQMDKELAMISISEDLIAFPMSNGGKMPVQSQTVSALPTPVNGPLLSPRIGPDLDISAKAPSSANATLPLTPRTAPASPGPASPGPSAVMDRDKVSFGSCPKAKDSDKVAQPSAGDAIQFPCSDGTVRYVQSCGHHTAAGD